MQPTPPSSQAAVEPASQCAPQHGHVLVVEDDPTQGKLVAFWLQQRRIHTTLVETGEGALAALNHSTPEAVLLDLQLPGISGLETLDRIRAQHKDLPVIILTADDSVQTVVQAMQRDAWDYLVKPLDQHRVVTTALNAIERYRMALRLRGLEHAVDDGGFAGMVGASAAMRQLYQRIERVAGTDVTVLIHGESGTGKELVATALHRLSARTARPFIALNCAAVPPTMQESELFGHERGAFTGAAQRREGRFEQARGGTLFLDEVGELSPELQAKLLRVLQERAFYRVGGNREVAVDVRILAATHRDLRAEVAGGGFREDLYYRLAVYELAVPPLRRRDDDIALLATAFLKRFGKQLGRPHLSFGGIALEALSSYRWPGNVRELQNIVKRAAINANGDLIERSDLPAFILAERSDTSGEDSPSVAIPVMPLDELERAAIAASMRRHDGRVVDVVTELGIPRTTLYRKLKGYGIR